MTDEAGRPLEDVEVIVPDLGRRALTDADGRYHLAELPAGRYGVVFRRLGYATLLRETGVEGASTLIVQLRATPTETGVVTVTATRAPIVVQDSPLPVTVLSAEALRRGHAISLARTIERLPGVRALTTGEQIGKPVIRGLSGPRVLVLDDGMRLEDYSWSDEDGPSVEARLADRVEVIRGPASILYGSDAIGGVVNVIPAPLPSPGARRHGEAELYGATNNPGGGGFARVEGARGRYGLRASLSARAAEDYRTPLGPLENTGYLSTAADVAVGTQGTWGSASLRVTGLVAEFHLLEAGEAEGAAKNGAALRAAEEEEGPVRSLNDIRVQGAGVVPLRRMRLDVRAGFQHHGIKEGEGEGKVEAPGTREFDLDLNTGTLDLAVRHMLGRGVTGTAGMSGFVQGNESDAAIPVVPLAETVSGAVFALEQADAGPLRLLGGLRYDVRSVRPDATPVLGVAGDRRTFGAFTWNAGAVAHLAPGVSVSGNAARGWRAPSLFELYSNGPRIGEQRFEIGNPNLEPETSLNVEGGAALDLRAIGQGLPDVRVEARAFRNRIDPYVFLRPTARFDGEFRIYEYGQTEAVLTGVEASVTASPFPWLSLEGRYDQVDGADRGADAPLLGVPPARTAGEVELHTSQATALARRAYVRAEVEHDAAQTHVSALDRLTLPGGQGLGSYTLVHVGAGVVRRVSGHDVWADLSVRNAGDVAYRDVLSRYRAFALNPGRSVALHVTAAF